MRNRNQLRPTAAQPRRTVAVLALETGGRGACAESVAALQALHYTAQLTAQGVTFVRSPRHADVVLLSGPFVKRADQAVRRVLDLVPEPQALVAVGNCAINGCVFAGSEEISSSAAEALDVHIELPGCPPTPTSILNAIVRAAELLAESAEDDQNEEAVDATDENGEDAEETDDLEAEADSADEVQDNPDNLEAEGKE